jgi:3-oxoacyl-[acyl-carrier protein] reductase
MDLSKAAALVTGGSSGIGRGIAELLVKRGARVAISGRNGEALARVAKEIGALPIQGDVSRATDVQRMVETVLQEFGEYNVLVNNAGVGSWATLIDTEEAEFRRVWETNVLGAMLVGRESGRHFVGRKAGNIVNIGSSSCLRAGSGGTCDASTKVALRWMSEAWRAELRQHNIRVMLVNPSEVVTDFFARSGRHQEDNPTKLHPREIAQAVVAALEMDDRGFIPELSVWATNPRE